MKSRLMAGVALTAVLMTGAAFADQKLIQVKGSDTIVNLAQAWAETFTAKTGKMVAVTGGGSGTGIAALIDGKCDIADASRDIKKSEIEQAKAKGVNPVEIVIGIDGLSVVVNKDNPVKALTPDNIGKLFRGEITSWKQLGGADAPVTLYGRQPNSGTYVFFQEDVLGNKDYSSKMNQMNGNAQILESVAKDPSAIGYVGVGYVVDENGKVMAGVKPLEIIGKDGKTVSPLDRAAVKSGKYPLARNLYQYTNGKPSGNVLELIKFELSEEGQKMVEKNGFDSITGDLVKKNEAVLK